MTEPRPVQDADADAYLAAYHAQAARRSAAMRAAFGHTLDISVGPHPKQVLDVYVPASLEQPAPVVAYVHGGGFRIGNPREAAYVGQALLERGVLFVSIGYRLLPDVQFPDTAEDVERALAWISREIASFGGDAHHLVLAGHSVGAILAADVALRLVSSAEFEPPSGLILISGNYVYRDLPPFMTDGTSPRWVPDLREAVRQYPRHTLIAAGANEQRPSVLAESQQLVDHLRVNGASVQHVVQPGVDHFYAADALADPASDLFEAAMVCVGSDPVSPLR